MSHEQRNEGASRPQRTCACTRSGFTLIELIAVIAVLAVLGTVGVVVFQQGAEIYATSSRKRESYLAARSALDRVTRELRELNQGSVGSATASGISFTNPYHSDLAGAGRVVTFRLSGMTLERSGDDGTSWAPVAEQVANTDVFTYYKIEAGAAAAFTPSAPYRDIQWILVKLEAGEGDDAAVLRQQVCLTRDTR